VKAPNPSARLASNRSGKDDFKFFFGGKFFKDYFFAKPNQTRRNKNSLISALAFLGSSD